MQGGFLPFLPEDNEGWKTENAIRSINEDLGALLCKSASEFWQVVQKDQSLHLCIDSYLRFKRRAYDTKSPELEGAFQPSLQLGRRIFLVILRMVTTAERDRGAPSPSQQADIIYNNWFLDIPKILDVCALYAVHSKELTAKLVKQIFTLQPQYIRDLDDTVQLLVANMEEVVTRASSLASRVQRGEVHLAPGLMDVVLYLGDVCPTLVSFVDCYPPAAQHLLQACSAQHTGASSSSSKSVAHAAAAFGESAHAHALLGILAGLHDKLLPQMGQALQNTKACEECGISQLEAAQRVNGLAACTCALASCLLRHTYLEQSATGEGSSSSSQAGPSTSAAIDSPEERGARLVAAFTELAATSSTTIHPTSSSSQPSALLVSALAHCYDLAPALATALRSKRIALDEAQMDYLMALLGEHWAFALRQAMDGSGSAAAAGSGSAGGSSRMQGGAGPGPSSSGAASSSGFGERARAMDRTQLMSLVSQVKDLLPDFGNGFIAACLEACGFDPEKAIMSLLDEQLPEQVQGMDRRLDVWPPPQPTTNTSSNSMAGAMSSWGNLASLASSGSVPQGYGIMGTPSAAPVPKLAAAPKAKLHGGTARVLGKADAEVRAATTKLGTELQYEEEQYDDEYDDSYDDLMGTRDGVADAEGDDDDAARAHAGAARPGSALPSISASAEPPRARPMGQPSGGRGRGSAPLSMGGPAGLNPTRQTPGQAGPRMQSGIGMQSAASAAAAAVSSRYSGGGPSSSSSAPGSSSSSASARRAPTYVPTGGAAAMGSPVPPAPGPSHHNAGGAGAPRGGHRAPRDGGKEERLWVLDGKIYNYAKEGAEVVSGGMAAAHAALAAAQEAAQAIHGLGAGGNKAAAARAAAAAEQQQQQQGRRQETAEDGDDEETGGGGRGRGPGGRGGSSGGRGAPNYARKEQNKAAVGNHHRKDRAMKKMGLM